jgi:hypothetical protein
MQGDDVRKQRYRRPEPARSAPVRSFATLFGPPRQGAAGDASERADAPALDRPRAAPDDDPIQHGVLAAYRVIEDYIGEGREIARRTSGAAPAPAARELDSAARNERMLRYASDMTAVGLELVQSLTLGQADTPAQQGASAGPFTSNRPVPHPAAARLTGAVLLRSPARSLHVRWELDAAAAGRRLRVDALRAEVEGLPALLGASVEWPPDEPAPCVCVPLVDDQAACGYRGDVLDAESGAVAGSLAVRVAERLAAE